MIEGDVKPMTLEEWKQHGYYTWPIPRHLYFRVKASLEQRKQLECAVEQAHSYLGVGLRTVLHKVHGDGGWKWELARGSLRLQGRYDSVFDALAAANKLEKHDG